MRYKPSRPAAVLTVLVGVGMLYFGISGLQDAGGGRGFLVFWCLVVVAVVGLNVWAAFSEKGSVATIVPFGAEVDDEDEDDRTDRR